MFVLEWSQSSNGFHVHPLDRAMAMNRTAFTEDRVVKYAVIATGTAEEMAALAEELRPILEYRNAARRDPE